MPTTGLTVHLRLRELILASTKIAVDETIAPVLHLGRSHAKQGYFRRRTGRWRLDGTNPPTIAFSYARGPAQSAGSSSSGVIVTSCNATAMPPTRRSLLRLARP